MQRRLGFERQQDQTRVAYNMDRSGQRSIATRRLGGSSAASAPRRIATRENDDELERARAHFSHSSRLNSDWVRRQRKINRKSSARDCSSNQSRTCARRSGKSP